MINYLCTQSVDNARIAKNHQCQRQKVTDEKCRYFYVAGEMDVCYTDSLDEIGRDTCHRCKENRNDNPDRDHH